MPLQQTSGNVTADAFGGGVAVIPTYIEQIFSTYLYTGNSSTQTITNGIDLAGKGGMTWIKCRTNAYDHEIFDTARGINKYIIPNKTVAQDAYGAYTDLLTSFDSTGFTLGADASNIGINRAGAGQTYASWTFRKQPKFFDVVTYTGNGTTNNITHALGSVPGCIIIKRTNGTGNWATFARDGTASSKFTYSYFSSAAGLNLTAAAAATGLPAENLGFISATTFSANNLSGSGAVGNADNINDTGATYVAYLFAHNAGGFGLTGTDNVISCGAFTTDGSGNCDVTLGYEPQFLITKGTDNGTNWNMVDTMRGATADGVDSLLRPNLSSAEISASNCFKINSTGFSGGSNILSPSTNIIYIAIRRGPMKVPTDATKVYATSTSDTVNNPEYISNFPVDMEISTNTLSGGNRNTSSRLLQGTYLFTNTTVAEGAGTQYDFAYNNGWATNAVHNSAYRSWMFRRAPGFFDEVCYTGNGAAGQAINHNLAAVPQLLILKKRNAVWDWRVYSEATGNSSVMYLNDVAASGGSGGWNNQTPTSTQFFLNGYNTSGDTYVAYLFATCPGVSKVGSYTGNGTTQTINCGFTAGARFVLIKRTDAAGDWYTYDTARGMTTLTDPYLLLNSTAAETATLGSVTTVTTGFALNSAITAAINVSGGTYIFLAIA